MSRVIFSLVCWLTVTQVALSLAWHGVPSALRARVWSMAVCSDYDACCPVGDDYYQSILRRVSSTVRSLFCIPLMIPLLQFLNWDLAHHRNHHHW
jgi:hypothetical protein